MTLEQRIEVLWEARKEAYRVGEDRLAATAGELIAAMERLKGNLQWIKESTEKLDSKSPSSFNPLGEFQAQAVAVDVAAGQAAVLAKLLEEDAQGAPESVKKLVKKALG